MAQCYFAFVLPLSSSTEVASARPQGDVAELCFTDASSLSVTLLRSDWVARRLFVVSGSWMVLPSLERYIQIQIYQKDQRSF